MTNDYTRTVPPIDPKTSNERLRPLLALIAAQIPSLLWGPDALLSNNVDYDVSRKDLQIVVRSSDLKAASDAIIAASSGKFSLSSRDALLKESPYTRYYYEADCAILHAPDNSGEYAPRWVVLIPEEHRHVSVLDGACSEPLAASRYFLVDKKRFKDAKVASFLGLLNSLLKEVNLWGSRDLEDLGSKETRLRVDGEAGIATDLVELVQWKTGCMMQRYKRMEDIPRELINILHQLNPENQSVFQKHFLRKDVRHTPTSSASKAVEEGKRATVKETAEQVAQPTSGEIRGLVMDNAAGKGAGNANATKPQQKGDDKDTESVDVKNSRLDTGDALGPREDNHLQPKSGNALKPSNEESSGAVGEGNTHLENDQVSSTSLHEQRIFFCGLKAPRVFSGTQVHGGEDNKAPKRPEGPQKEVQSWVAKKLKVLQCFGERDGA